MSCSQITLARGRFGTPASQIVEQARAYGPLSRDDLSRRTGLSPATIKRSVAALLDVGLLRERPDHIEPGLIGRPGVPVEIDPDAFVTMGFHLGRGVDTVALGDLRGRVLAERRFSRPIDEPPVLAELATAAAQLLANHPGRAPLSAGVVAPWTDLELDRDQTAASLHDILGLDVTSADHVAGVAACEFLHRRSGTGGTTLYVYARNTVGYAVATDRGQQTEVSRVGSLTHFPCDGTVYCPCGHLGCLTANYSDHALVARARSTSLLAPEDTIDDLLESARSGSKPAHQLLTERARTLGRVAAIVRDITAPDRVVLVGQAFTGYPPVLSHVVDAFNANTSLGEADLSFTRFGAGVQAVTACTIALGSIYDDPLGVVPTNRPTSPAKKGNIA